MKLKTVTGSVIGICILMVPVVSFGWFNSPSSLSESNDLKWPTQLREVDNYVSGNHIYDRATKIVTPRLEKQIVERRVPNYQGGSIVVREEDTVVVFDEKPLNYSSSQKPAVILLHSCAGMKSRTVGDLLRWTKFLTENGYVVLVMDHLTKREVRDNCYGRRREVTKQRLVKDVFDATAHLHTLPNIDKRRIFTLGFSLGAMTGPVVAASIDDSDYKGKPHPTAVAGLYGGCAYPAAGEVWLDGSEKLPVLWLMGSADNEAPAAPCLAPVKKLKEQDPRNDWHLYEGASHCWDCQGLNGSVTVAPNGAKETYRYNEEYTKDSERRVLKFFKQFD
jgi:dienelactone hydrolase